MIRGMIIAAAALLLAVPAAAQEKPEPPVTDFNRKAEVKVDPASGYIYFDMRYAMGLWLVRMPTPAEVAEREAQRAEARTKHSGRNLVLALREIDWASRQKRMVSNGNRNFMPVVKDAEGKSWSGILIKLPPGRYVIAGYGAETYMHPSMCFCLGTVMFDAVPGKIVDLGRVYSHAQENGWSLVARPRTIDGLTSGRNLNSLYIAPRATPVVLPRIGGAEVIPAEFQAVGRITNALNSEIDRVTPIQGVIRYEPGKIIDARTNQPVPPLDL